MPRRKNVFERVFNAAIFIVMEVAALNMLSHNAEAQRLWIAKGAHSFMAATWGSTQRVKEYFSLRGENRALAEENFRLRTELLRLGGEAPVSGNVPAKVRGFEYLPAEVVKMSRNRQHNYLIISKGYEDGVKEKSGIVTGRGVVGIIDEVSAHHAFAFSLQNADISVSARIGKEGAVGPLVWDGVSGDGALLKEIPLQYRFAPGDTVYTSGYSSIFPPDIPLGIAGEAKVINGATNEIRVTLLENFKALRYVTVVYNTQLEELEGFTP